MSPPTFSLHTVFSYLTLHRGKSDNPDLFIAASVFLAPMFFSSIVAMVLRAQLIQRRIQSRAATRSRAGCATRAFTPGARRAALRMLMEQFVLQHDQLAWEERSSANAADRYGSYGYMLGILCEVRTGSSRTMRIDRGICLLAVGHAVWSDQRDLSDAAGNL